jgi:hypothetical protein
MGLANGGFGQQRRQDSRRITAESEAEGWMSMSRKSTLPIDWQAGHSTSSTAVPASSAVFTVG